MNIDLAALSGLAEGACREFELEGPAEPLFCFAVRHQGRLYLYRNSCPHTGVTLNWLPDQFLTEEGDYLQCSLHGALFRIEDGFCVRGPCVGRSLQTVALPASSVADDSGRP